MRAEDPGGGRPVTPTPQRRLSPKPKSTPAPSTNWTGLSAFRDTEQQVGPPAPQQQLYPLVAPARASVIDVVQQKKPLSVEIMPQQLSGLIQAQSGTSSPWFSDSSSYPPRPQTKGVDSGYDPLRPQTITEALNKEQQLEKLESTDRARLRKEYEAADRKETSKELTPKQWASLSPLQQASAQANYDLALAVKRDIDTSGKREATDTQRKSYDDRVKALFGEEPSLGYKGVEYAPNTIAFLDSHGIEAANLAGRTLDDFLSGAALSTTEIFKDLGEQVKSPDNFHTAPADARGQNIQFAQQLAKGQLAYQEKLAATLKKGTQLLTEITSASTNVAANKTYGAEVAAASAPAKLTAVRPETLAQFDKYMQALARTDIPVDQALKTISLDLQELGASSDETAQVWEGLIERSRQGVTGEGKWFEGVDFPMRSPVEVAQALGAPTLKRQATLGAK